ncbi:MAG: porin, partial [Pseudomonadota bacterium]
MRNVFRPTYLSARAGLAALLIVAGTLQGASADNHRDQFARRGQPKVTLKLSGWISMGMMSWRDGVEHGAAVVDNGEQNSRLKFSAATRFGRDMRAGANIELGLSGNFPGAGGIPSSNCIDQNSRDCGPRTPIIRTQEIWLQHKRLGKLQLGTGSPPSRLVKNFAGRIASNQFWGMDSSPQVGMNLLLRGASQNIGRLRWRHLIDGRVGPFREQLAWTSPKLANFTLSVGAGTDDHWDAALYYANRHLWGFNVFGAIAFIADRTPSA